ncbi:MAG: tetratricopeptide repeat protein [Candidatus Celaenobacter antarcticus]|nr:tetratricopeptide repeat protein [Candidatus Celaenobacter antarcticus]
MKKFLILLIYIFLATSLAAKTFIREYSYQAGEADSKLSARAIALEQVKRLLLEEVGVYISTSLEIETTEISNEVKELTKQDIEVISAGITETKIVDEKWNGESYWLKAEIQLDENDVLKRLEDLVNNTEYKKAIEDSRKTTDAALAEIEKLKLELEQEKDKNKQAELQQAYTYETEKLSSLDLYDKGCEAFYNDDLQQAVSFLQESVKIDPSSISAWFTLGIVNQINSDYGQAIKCYNKILELDSLDLYALVGLGDIYQDKHDYDQAISYYKKALKIDPQDISAYINLAMTYENIEYYDEAIACYEEMMKFNTDNEYEIGCLARIYEFKEDYPNAIKYYLLVIEQSPDDLMNLMYLGDAYFKTENYSQAIAAYSNALVLEPENIWVLNSLGQAYFYLGDREKGYKYYIKSAQMGDTEIQNWCDTYGIEWRITNNPPKN